MAFIAVLQAPLCPQVLTGLAIFSDNKREAQSACISPTAADDDDLSLAVGALCFIGPTQSLNGRG